MRWTCNATIADKNLLSRKTTIQLRRLYYYNYSCVDCDPRPNLPAEREESSSYSYGGLGIPPWNVVNGPVAGSMVLGALDVDARVVMRGVNNDLGDALYPCSEALLLWRDVAGAAGKERPED